jgi:hypothetical protein
MKNLFNIDADLFALHQQIEENFGELTPEMESLLEISEQERSKKSEGYVHIIKQLKAKSEMIKAEAKRLQDLAKTYEKSADQLSDRLLDSIVRLGAIKTDFVSISTRRSKSVSITDESLISGEFMRISYSPNKAAIKEAIESGVNVDGALIVENVSLNIR